MSGTPTQDEIQQMWTNAVDLLEKQRVYADAAAAAGGELDVFEQALEGEYAPELALVSSSFRAGLSDLVSQGFAQSFFEPLAFEYAKFISDNPGVGTGWGTGSDDVAGAMQAIYDHMVNTSETVESRNITYQLDASMTKTNGYTGSVVGTGTLHRLTVDFKAFDLEACNVEKKVFRCLQDQNTGTKEEAEVFSVMGEASSRDALLGVSSGSGTEHARDIAAKHAGTGPGGSLLRNSSFSTYSASATPKFTGWDLAAGTAADVTQDTSNTYRDFPGSTTSGSLKIATSVSDTKTLKQTVANIRVSQLDPTKPYFCSIMVNKTIGTAVGGTVVLRCGSVSESIDISALGANWQELRIGTTTPKDSWARNFNQDGFDIEIEWTQSTSTGFLLVDDAIFSEWDEIDGTFWALRQAHATAPLPWLVDDTIEVTDSGGAPATAEVQYWLWRSGLG
jgi:hypothetical protein